MDRRAKCLPVVLVSHLWMSSIQHQSSTTVKVTNPICCPCYKNCMSAFVAAYAQTPAAGSVSVDGIQTTSVFPVGHRATVAFEPWVLSSRVCPEKSSVNAFPKEIKH